MELGASLTPATDGHMRKHLTFMISFWTAYI
jgi:hypothetical protein